MQHALGLGGILLNNCFMSPMITNILFIVEQWHHFIVLQFYNQKILGF